MTGGAARTLSADVLFAVDAHQRIVVWNKEASRVLGYDGSIALGRPCYQVLAGCDEDGHRFCRESCSVISNAVDGQALPAPRLTARTSSGTKVVLDVSTIVLSFDEDLHAVIHVCRVPGPTRPDTVAEDFSRLCLTAREEEVLHNLCAGQGTDDIAEALGISATTVRNHLQRLMNKLGVHTRSEAIALAFRLGIVS